LTKINYPISLATIVSIHVGILINNQKPTKDAAFLTKQYISNFFSLFSNKLNIRVFEKEKNVLLQYLIIAPKSDSSLVFFFEEAKMIYISQNGSTSTRCAKKTTQNEYKVGNMLPYISTTNKKKLR